MNRNFDFPICDDLGQVDTMGPVIQTQFTVLTFKQKQ